MSPVYIIAEAGVNHNGSLDRAREMIHVAASAGVDAVKFQTFVAENLVTRSAVKAGYQQQATGTAESQFEMLKKLELSLSDFQELKYYCEKNGVEFLSTPFDLLSVDLLVDLGVRQWKIPSGEITNLPYLRKIGARNEKIFLSTGMCNLVDIEAAVGALEAAGTERSRIIVLHCNTEYPTPFEDVNLYAMNGIHSNLPGLGGVGYSDHTLGIEIAIAAVALGAKVIEKHFTLDRNLPGPDHRASLEAADLVALVSGIRNVERAMGSGEKRPSPSEIKNRNVARKSLVASRQIKKGELFSEKNLAVKRPGVGVSPLKWDEYIGLSAGRDYSANELIDA